MRRPHIVQALEKNIHSWIAVWNTDPNPYIWTKTTDEILERLSICLNRTPDSEGPREGL
ncbi:hypothetical protein [Streptomyces tendae]|uniref:hypothetical protein n=1 Tax=Streptomyces tendae TaxID=1932 RepID=UPI0037191D11